MSSTRTKLHLTREIGQSIWFDNLSRDLLVSGELAGLCAQGIMGLTSNPTIFEKAIAGSSTYDEALHRLSEAGRSAREIYEELAVDDIRAACDLLRPIYDETGGVDGRVSLEVLPELASNTAETIAEAKRLAGVVARPNLMIKVPATAEGIPAVRALTAAGISVNVTLIFSVAQYEQVAEAYVAGLEERAAAGGELRGIASVASFFVSRVDTACDKLLEAKAAGGADAAKARALVGKIGIANSKRAYEHYRALVAGPRWGALAARGAKPQRLLWASTGTKDKRYSDTLYVDQLCGPDTVDTVPPATLLAFLDHGNPSAALGAGLDEARRQLDDLASLGIDLAKICEGLLADGVRAFEASMTTLLSVVDARRAAHLDQRAARVRVALPPADAQATSAALESIIAERSVQGLWDADPRVFFGPGETEKAARHEASIKTRLGWLRSPVLMRSRASELQDFAAEVRAAGFKRAVLLGMGGSSLCPEVLSQSSARNRRGIPVDVLDNTDPAAVRAIDAQLHLPETLFIVASKSGSTIEIQSFEKHFWSRVLAACEGDVARAGSQFVAITDPNTRLGNMAEQKRYRRTFVNPADIGGRYSALSYFGMVPAALLGMDLEGLLDAAVDISLACSPPVPAGRNPGVELGVLLGALARDRGRDKLTLLASPQLASFGSWVEQLVAESTGKDGKGILPVDLEPVGAPAVYGADRLFVYLRSAEDDCPELDARVDALQGAGLPVVRIALERPEALGREFFRWEMATAIASCVLRLNPFDEPNVTEAKVSTNNFLGRHAKDGKLPDVDEPCRPSEGSRVAAHLASAGPGEYEALLAYFPRTPQRDELFSRIRVACRDRLGVATTLGYGPRYLHSTGQLHKGGPNNGVFLQLTSDTTEDLPVPGESYSFAVLRNAQALGDLDVLRRHGRRALRVHLGSNIDAALAELASALEQDGTWPASVAERRRSGGAS